MCNAKPAIPMTEAKKGKGRGLCVRYVVSVAVVACIMMKKLFKMNNYGQKEWQSDAEYSLVRPEPSQN